MVKIVFEDRKSNAMESVIPDAVDGTLLDAFVAAIQPLTDAEIVEAKLFTWLPFAAGALGTGHYDAITQHIKARFTINSSGGIPVGTGVLKVPTPLEANVEDAGQGKGKKRWTAATLTSFVSAVKALVGGTNVYLPKSGYLYGVKANPR